MRMRRWRVLEMLQASDLLSGQTQGHWGRTRQCPQLKLPPNFDCLERCPVVRGILGLDGLA